LARRPRRNVVPTDREEDQMRGALRAGIGTAIAGIAVAAAPAVAAASAGCPASLSPANERVLTHLIAAERKAEHVPTVRVRSNLRKLGRTKSLRMANGGAFEHSSGGSSSGGDLAFARGKSGAQNIAQAPTARMAFRAMMASPPHRANMMGPRWRFTGIGAAKDCQGQVFFTVNYLGS
jgi:uncharacterized protein YkwD